jgi:hypothetical protein
MISPDAVARRNRCCCSGVPYSNSVVPRSEMPLLLTRPGAPAP